MARKQRNDWFTGETIKHLTKDEAERFFRAVGDRKDQALFLTIYRYGLRVSEGLRLRWEDIDFDRLRVRIQRLKGGYGAECPLSQDVRKCLRYLRRRSTSPWVFEGRDVISYL